MIDIKQSLTDMRAITAEALARAKGDTEQALTLVLGAVLIFAHGSRSVTGTLADVIVSLNAHLREAADMTSRVGPDVDFS